MDAPLGTLDANLGPLDALQGIIDANLGPLYTQFWLLGVYGCPVRTSRCLLMPPDANLGPLFIHFWLLGIYLGHLKAHLGPLNTLFEAFSWQHWASWLPIWVYGWSCGVIG